MTIIEIEERIKKVIREQLDIEPDVCIDSKDSDFLVKFNLNSVDALELLLMVEKEFEVEIDDSDLNADLLSTINSLATYVFELCQENNS